MGKVVPVLAIYAGEARAKLEKLQRRAAKYGQVISWSETKRTEVQIIKRPDGQEIKREIERIDFDVEGEAPRVGDFKFLASLERAEGGVLVSAVKHDGPDIGKLGYKWDGRCEHCRTNRMRQYGYVVEDEKGKRKVVGKTCLRDYVGTDVPAAALWIFESVREFGGSDEEGGWSGGYGYAELIEGVVAITRAAIAIWGWRPSSHEGISTSSYVSMYTSPRRDTDRRGRDIWADERRQLDEELKARGDFYEAEALKVVEWGRNLKPRGDYEHNLKVAMSGTYVVGKTFNLVVSACAAYDRQVAVEDEAKARRLAEEAERAAINALPPSKFAGSVGGKVAFDEVIVDRVLAMPDNGFGPSQLYKFKALSGELLCWFTGSFPKVGGAPVKANERFKLAGTVKSHRTYNEVEETQIIRAKLERIGA